MANFQTHIFWGGILGAACVIAALILSLTSAVILLPLIFIFVLIGSLLPDLDSDESVPFHVLISILSIGLAGFAFYHFYGLGKDYKILTGVTIDVFLFVRFFIGMLFKKFTEHRGIIHSIPMALVVSLITLLALRRFNLVSFDRMLLAISIGLGFFLHLILDEIKSAVSFRGIFFKPKKSLGSALKLFSRSKSINIIIYSVLAILIYLNWTTIASFL